MPGREQGGRRAPRKGNPGALWPGHGGRTPPVSSHLTSHRPHRPGATRIVSSQADRGPGGGKPGPECGESIPKSVLFPGTLCGFLDDKLRKNDNRPLTPLLTPLGPLCRVLVTPSLCFESLGGHPFCPPCLVTQRACTRAAAGLRVPTLGPVCGRAGPAHRRAWRGRAGSLGSSPGPGTKLQVTVVTTVSMAGAAEREGRGRCNLPPEY